MVKNLPVMQETWVQSLGQEDPQEKGMATHSNILTWRIPLTEEHGRLQSMGHKESDTTEQLTLSLFSLFTLSPIRDREGGKDNVPKSDKPYKRNTAHYGFSCGHVWM